MGALALSLFLLTFMAVYPERAHAQEEDYRTGELVVRLDPGVTITRFLNLYPTLERLDGGLPHNLASRNIYLLEAPASTNVRSFAQNLLANEPLVDGIAEPNFVASTPEYAAGDGRMRARGISSNKQSSEANATFATNLNLSTCSRNIKGATVAVLDTGAQLNHPRLTSNFKGVTRNDYDFVANDATPSDELFYTDESGNSVEGQMAGHGTHVTGIVDQVAPEAKIMALRVLDPEGTGDVYTVARAIAYAVDQGVEVINLSLGTSEHSELLEAMVEEATGENVVVTAAAGNSNIEEPHYPAAGRYNMLDALLRNPIDDGLLGVTSLDKAKLPRTEKSEFATYGFWVDVSAPGEDIRSTYLRDKYANWSGTSMATPFISGQAALIRATNASLTSGDIELRIRTSSNKAIYDLLWHGLLYKSKYEDKLGAGHADVCASL